MNSVAQTGRSGFMRLAFREVRAAALSGFSADWGYHEGLSLPREQLFGPTVSLIPEELANLDEAAIFISAGRSAQIVPRGESDRLAKLLGDAGGGGEDHRKSGTPTLTEQGERDGELVTLELQGLMGGFQGAVFQISG